MRNMTSEKIIGYVSEQFGVDKDSLSRDTSSVSYTHLTLPTNSLV